MAWTHDLPLTKISTQRMSQHGEITKITNFEDPSIKGEFW